MTVALIAAMAKNRTIGAAGSIPWHIPYDLARFRELTWGHPIIMGRRTFEGIGRKLPGRTMIVLSHSAHKLPPDCLLAHSLPEALALSTAAPQVFICGGSELYREAMPLAESIYLTVVEQEYPGDRFFPPIDPNLFYLSETVAVPGEPPIRFETYMRKECRGTAQ